MAFKNGDKVQSKSDPSKVGIIEELGPMHAGLQYYTVFWGGIEGTTIAPEIDLQFYRPAKTPIDNLLNGNLAGYKEFLRLITFLKLMRDYPLRNNIYAFNASRTRFYPYQFKPLIKFLDSPSQRLLICDEVGLGKTIEAGLILTEIRARQTVNRVLVICPANLTAKWKLELKNRFGEDFRVYQVRDFIEYLKEYEEEPENTKLNGIISLESIRTKRSLERLDSLLPNFDLIIIDEAHHMRNPGKQRNVGILLGQSASAMIMLTATPIHLGNENLFSLLNILDEEDFPDFITSDLRFRQNEPIVKAQICLGQIPQKILDSKDFLTQSEDSPWIKNNPLYSEVIENFGKIPSNSFDPCSHKKHLIELQRDLAELNLLSHIFTRTRRREVHENVAERRAFALEVKFTLEEREFYEAVTVFIISQSETYSNRSLRNQWRLNMPQRRLASSIHAMVEYYHDHFFFENDDLPDDFEETKFNINNSDSAPADFKSAQKHLKTIVKNWPSNAYDSKYEKFKEVLDQLRGEETCKVIVFAFFKGTLKYLSNRLKADGIRTLLISGDIGPDERSKIIDKFQNNPDIKVLLSSRVGSEGLDFQFCNTLFNYDLPWNPMEVEQRIGRIDRIGQESPIIRIYNLWIKNTIEERILRRLYERIHIFERSIGALEMILGDIIQQLEREVFSESLTPEEQNKKTEGAILAIERKLNDLERLESEAAQFIGTDQYFENEVESIRYRRRYVTGEQLKRFIVDFFKNHTPRTRLVYDGETSIGRLYPDEKLKSFITDHHKSSYLARFLATNDQGVEVTFDAQVAFRNPKVEFINVLHPLVMAIIEEYKSSKDNLANSQHILLQTDLLQKGFYYYLVFRLRVNAARARNTLECIILNENHEEACDFDTAEVIFGEMIEKGEEPQGLPIDVNPNDAGLACSKAHDSFLRYIKELRSDIERKNDSFVDRRLASLITSYEKNIKKQQNLLDKALKEQRQERYIRMLKGTIKRLESELTERRGVLEQKRNVGVEYDEIAAGILEVV